MLSPPVTSSNRTHSPRSTPSPTLPYCYTRTHTPTHTHSTTATGVPKGDPTYDLYTQYFRTPYFIDDVVARAFGGVKPFTKDEDRVQLIVKSLQSSLQFSIMMHLLESAAALAK